MPTLRSYQPSTFTHCLSVSELEMVKRMRDMQHTRSFLDLRKCRF